MASPSRRRQKGKRSSVRLFIVFTVLIFACLVVIGFINVKVSSQLLRKPSHAAPLTFVDIQTDVRGNLGPPTALLSNGTDWLKDRWQAASDMHGTAIKGAHWVALELDRPAHVTKVVLDWETAYSEDYSLVAIVGESYEVPLLDTRREKPTKVTESGLSPGVPKLKLPLHIVHTWELPSIKVRDYKKYKLLIRSPFHQSWGVSLWRVELTGY